jgi:hypothetical protein
MQWTSARRSKQWVENTSDWDAPICSTYEIDCKIAIFGHEHLVLNQIKVIEASTSCPVCSS